MTRRCRPRQFAFDWNEEQSLSGPLEDWLNDPVLILPAVKAPDEAPYVASDDDIPF